MGLDLIGPNLSLEHQKALFVKPSSLPKPPVPMASLTCSDQTASKGLEPSWLLQPSGPPSAR